MISADDAPSGGVVDDDAATLRDHGGQNEFRHQEGAFEVDVDLLVPLFFGTFEGCLRIEDAGVVEENVDAAVGVESFFDSAAAVTGGTDVGAEKDSGIAELLEALEDSFSAITV